MSLVKKRPHRHIERTEKGIGWGGKDVFPAPRSGESRPVGTKAAQTAAEEPPVSGYGAAGARAAPSQPGAASPPDFLQHNGTFLAFEQKLIPFPTGGNEEPSGGAKNAV